jgi:8-oxo-dGTP diphosphatase
MKKLYVVGFLFSEECDRVALVRKNRPEWQAGKLNGIGGKIEANETPDEAMVREFEEETGMMVPKWEEFCTLEGDNSLVYCFKAIGDVTQVRTVETERIEVHSVERLLNFNYSEALPNLRWLIPMAMEQNMTASVYHKQ